MEHGLSVCHRNGISAQIKIDGAEVDSACALNIFLTFSTPPSVPVTRPLFPASQLGKLRGGGGQAKPPGGSENSERRREAEREPFTYSSLCNHRCSSVRQQELHTRILSSQSAAMVLVLFETAVGLALFRMSDSAKITSPSLADDLADPTKASNLLKLSAISRFTSTAEAVDEASSIAEGKMSKSLKKLLTDEIVDQEGGKKGKGKNEQLVVVDPKLGGSISKKLGINVISDSSVNDLYRGIRSHLAQLLSSTASEDSSLDPRDLNTMSLGLSHSLSRYKLKFSPDKVDTMVVQAIGLLDDLDKEINIYAMRVKVSVCNISSSETGDARLTYNVFAAPLCSSGMVRMALPRDGQDFDRQPGLRQGHPCDGLPHKCFQDRPV